MTYSRQPRGIPGGGQFVPTAHAEPGFDLNSSAPAVSVPFQGSVDLHNRDLGNLPPLPASVGTPEMAFDFNIDGKLETHVNVGGSKMSFSNDDMADEITNTVESGRSGEDDEAPWSGIAERGLAADPHLGRVGTRAHPRRHPRCPDHCCGHQRRPRLDHQKELGPSHRTTGGTRTGSSWEPRTRSPTPLSASPTGLFPHNRHHEDRFAKLLMEGETNIDTIIGETFDEQAL
ncbi:hypothetical protein FBY31_0563 [Arthrobacter sp. SLBN-100]|uniref:hypothetical protein n=1 Tax=Arthrobacter sp. SLBN-100 TaxID=2768450 RepID=UPI00114E02B7|nr:hypothetical protein [Arthrobacter sp. SLBN-100]TQJ66548.1 hypothetical protein FBY31_0563 [Arthrobacter sp. SLBN-100]